MESSRRDMFIDMVLIGLSSKVTKLRSPSVSRSYPKQVWLYLKQGGSFYCVESENCVTWGKAIHDKTRIPEGAEMKAKKGKEINELVKHVISSDRPTDFLFISRWAVEIAEIWEEWWRRWAGRVYTYRISGRWVMSSRWRPGGTGTVPNPHRSGSHLKGIRGSLQKGCEGFEVETHGGFFRWWMKFLKGRIC